MHGSGRIAPRLKIAMPGEYFFIDTGWLMDDPQPCSALTRHRKTRYRALAKNTSQLFTLFAFANLVLAGRRFTVTETRRAS
jgi:IS5 family transposase